MHISQDGSGGGACHAEKSMKRSAAPAVVSFREDASPEICECRRLRIRQVCRAVSLLAAEMVLIAGGEIPGTRESRRRKCHLRQIAMYVCHVAIGMTLTDVGIGFARDRSTVAYSCAVVEDRRDDRPYDEFIAALERVAASMLVARGEDDANA